MNFTHHDINSSGFFVETELLAHDLALMKLNKSCVLNEKSNISDYYTEYLKALKDFRDLLDDKTRYDSAME